MLSKLIFLYFCTQVILESISMNATLIEPIYLIQKIKQ
jgi:hypothetical protein